ncbi:uncharacterized protein si:dkey-52l18.4 [Betta splendens]|uniref:Uncharacterized protein si:dkey-52l18.4 n=1 Tax=Betta splendens TaxID=158456 RepID=A0A6P7P8E8_BETSP|nr:uncharacterized protein si:dkey-52l18.4 [Betta splendens]
MHGFLLGAVIVCVLPHGFTTEDCIKAVLAKRDTVFVPEGGSLSLSCDIQNCGEAWTGNWVQTYSGKSDQTLIDNSDRHRVTNVTLSANTTRLLLDFLSVNKSDEGFYRCSVQWDQGGTGQGHFVYVNVTAAVTKRMFWHRALVWSGACVCSFIILILARCLRSEVRPQPLPRPRIIYHRDQPHAPANPQPPVPKKRTKLSYKAPARSEQRTEVVYADISQDALRQQQEAVREPASSTVYSSVKFS